MKYFKFMIRILFIFLFLFTIHSGIQSHKKIEELNESYQTYYTEDANIQIRLHGGKNSLNHKNYPQISKYHEVFDEVNNYYKKISKEAFIEDMALGYNMYINAINNLVGSDYFEVYDHDLIEGRFFTKEEITNGKYVAVLNSNIKQSKPNLQIGDQYTFTHYGEKGYTEISVEVIGFYNDKELTNIFMEDAIFMPNKAIKQISDTWFNDCLKYDEKRLYEEFAPASILNPILTVKNEENYDKLLPILEKYIEDAPFEFSITRIDLHKKYIDSFDTSEYKEKMDLAIYNSITILIIYFVLETIRYLYEKYRIKKFEKIVLEEQEKNVQTIFQMNQEAHQLKHDMKHFLTQMSILLENNEIDKIKELLKDYQSDINHLEIPAYTQNKIIDLVVNHYMNQAKKENIDFTFSSTFVPQLKLKDRKLYILLSNALENAFIHNDSRKRVSMNITYIEPYYRIVIMNTTDFKEKEEDKNHGYGLKSMTQIMNQIQGEILIEKQEDKYILTLLIPE